MNIKPKLDDDDALSRFQKIIVKCSNLKEPLTECVEIVASSIEQNFQSEGRFSEPGSWRGGSNSWSKSGAAAARGGMTLSDSGQLRSSVQKNVSIKSASVTTNKEYAPAHNFGFDDQVNVKSHKRKTKSGKVCTVRAHTRQMHVTARPFMVIQNEDITDMVDAVEKHVLD